MAARPTATVYVALGLNIAPYGWRWQRLCRGLSRLPNVTVLAVTPPCVSAALGPGVRGRFWNGAALLTTSAPPLVLLARCKRLERRLGRRGSGDRPADVDIALWRQHGRWRRLDLPRLRVPHVQMAQRAFVWRPLLALNPPRPLPAALERRAARQGRMRYADSSPPRQPVGKAVRWTPTA